MISSISNSHKYEWVLTTKGVPDMRLRKNRENMLHMAKELDRALVIERRKKGETECAICMESMCGRVTLKCGHEMCPECFANHARMNHTCPFCRDEFATKHEPRVSIPQEGIVALAEELCGSTEDYFARAVQVIQNTDLVEGTHYLEYLIKMNAILLGRSVADWYDA